MSDLSHHPTTTTVFRGTILRASDAAYDDAHRVFNGLIDSRPDRILRCHSTEDVLAALSAARFEGRPVSVYGGGHGVTGSARWRRQLRHRHRVHVPVARGGAHRARRHADVPRPDGSRPASLLA